MIYSEKQQVDSDETKERYEVMVVKNGNTHSEDNEQYELPSVC